MTQGINFTKQQQQQESLSHRRRVNAPCKY